jgi:proteasome lid subunit RPN8/RPN11
VKSVLREIERQGQAAYPHESCGFLLGSVPESNGRPREVAGIVPACNQAAPEQSDRFLISAEELRSVERRLEGTGRAVVGVYHSHPDGPARPSVKDRDDSWPWYTYLVTSVARDAAGQTHAFELDPDRREFLEVELRVGPSGSPTAEAQTLSTNSRS